MYQPYTELILAAMISTVLLSAIAFNMSIFAVKILGILVAIIYVMLVDKYHFKDATILDWYPGMIKLKEDSEK